MSSSRPELKHRHSLSPFSEITPSHTPGTWTPKTPIHIATRSFENLVALAKDQELRREAKKLVWRSRGEHPAELDTIEACLDHAWKGGQRAGTLAFGIRAGVNLFLLLFRIIRTPRKLKFALVRHAIFGTDTFRFAAMLGSFVAIYKFLINSLPLLPNEKLPSILQYTPPSSHSEFESGTRTPEGPLYMKRKEEKKPASTTEEKPSSRDVFVRKPVARWHSLVAGAVAGLAAAFETKGRRLTIAQQMFVRGLQGSYNYWSKQYGIQIPYGSVMVFSLCCGQILYAFLLSPDTIPRSYREWIQRASKVPAAGVSMNFDLVRKGTFKVADIKELIDWERTTPGNRKKLMAELEAATTKGDFGPEFASCAAVHPFFDSCKSVPLDRFLTVSAWMVPIYGALHFIPMLLFKRKEFVKQPLKMLARSAYGTARSSAFLGVFVMIYQTYFCMKHNLYLAPRLKWIPPHLRVALISRASWWLGGLLSGFSLFVEDKRRREELAMYVLPRGLESAWSVMRRRGWVPIVPGGENLLCAFGMAMVMATYQTSPQHLSGLVRRVLYQFIGPN